MVSVWQYAASNDVFVCLGYGVELSQSEYNLSSAQRGKSLFAVSSNLSVTAKKTSCVDCLVSVSSLPAPLRSSIRLTVGETPPASYKSSSQECPVEPLLREKQCGSTSWRCICLLPKSAPGLFSENQAHVLIFTVSLPHYYFFT